MLTGRADHESVVEAMRNKVSAYITKPYSIDQLKKKIMILANRMFDDVNGAA